MSAYREQKKYLEVLKKYERNFTRQEYDEFDTVSMKRLKELHDKYHKPVDTSKYDKFFKKTDDKTSDN